MEINVTKDELFDMIKNAVRDVIHEEKIDIILKNIPDISDDEMKDIEDLYGKPDKKKDVASSEKIEI